MAYGLEILYASVFTVVCVISARIYSALNRAYTYWDRKNVKGPIPAYFIGTWKGYAEKVVASEDYVNCKTYGRVYGTYDGLTPNLAVTHPDMIKEILVSSADSFQDIRVLLENSVIMKDSLLSLCGGEKLEVQTLTNSLLNSQKLDKLIPKLESSVEHLIRNIIDERQENGEVNITSSVTEFINHAVALTIFGIDLEANDEVKEEFIKNIGQILRVKTPQSIMSLLPFLYPKFFKDPWIIPEKSLQYFTNLVTSGISESTSETPSTEEKASNLIQLMVEAAKEEEKLVKKEKEGENGEDIVLKDNVIISKCIASVLALSNATRTTLLLGMHALAENEDVQSRLSSEIEKNKSEKLSYGDIQSLDFLDKVVKEVMRLYPFEYRLERITTKNVKIGEVELEKEVRVSIPLYALHRSEDIYPEPDKFDPERFSQSNFEKQNPFTYLPFGQAGVNGFDISLQLGVLAVKLALIRLVEKFKFSEVQISKVSNLFEKGFTRIPQPLAIHVLAESRNEK